MYWRLILFFLVFLTALPALATQKKVGGVWTEKPVYKKVGGVWEQKPTYKKINGQWVQIGGTTPSVTKCIGWPNVDCVGSTANREQVAISADRTYLREWTATEAGNITRLRALTGTITGDNTPTRPAVYKITGGTTWELICTAVDPLILTDQNEWNQTWLPFDSGDCSFDSGDVLRFGVAIDRRYIFNLIRTSTSDETYPTWFSSATVDSGPPTDGSSFSVSQSSYDMGFIMEYETL